MASGKTQRRTRRLWGLGFPVCAYLAFCGVVWSVQDQMVYFPDPEISAPEDYRLARVETWTLPTSDGEELLIWSSPAQPGQSTIVYFHGNGGNLSYRNGVFRMFQEMGLGFVAMSYRGYAGSTGVPQAKLLHADADALLDHLNVERGIPDDQILVFGESLGTGLATQMAATRDLAGLIIQSGYTSTAEYGQRAFPFLPVRLLMTERFDNLGRIGDVEEPILIIHGSQDELFPVEMAQRNAAAATPPVTPVIIEGAGHNLDERMMGPHISDFLTDIAD